MRGYFRLNNPSLFSTQYMYIDHENKYSFDIFHVMHLKVRVKREMKCHRHSYHIIFVKVKNKDIKKFEHAMSLLIEKLSSEDDSYKQVCREINVLFQK